MIAVGQLYKLDFPNGKAYIGITIKTAEARFAQHHRAAGAAKPNCAAVYRAWRKHGAPTLTVLAIVEDEDLYETEKRAIAVFGTLAPGGYNLTEGGESSPANHPDVRARIGTAHRGKTVSAEARARMSVAQRARAPASAETRAKIAAALRGRKKPPEHVEKVAAANRGRKNTPDAIARMSAANRVWKHSAETRARMVAAQRARRAAEKAFKE